MTAPAMFNSHHWSALAKVLAVSAPSFDNYKDKILFQEAEAQWSHTAIALAKLLQDDNRHWNSHDFDELIDEHRTS